MSGLHRAQATSNHVSSGYPSSSGKLNTKNLDCALCGFIIYTQSSVYCNSDSTLTNSCKMAGQSERSSSGESQLIDNELALNEAISELHKYKQGNNNLLAVDCEGVSLSRKGELTICP